MAWKLFSPVRFRFPCCFSTSAVAKWLSDASSFQGGPTTAEHTPSFLFLYHISVSTTIILSTRLYLLLAIFSSLPTSLTRRLPWYLWSQNASPEAALFVVADDHLRFEWGLDAFDVSCLPNRPLTVISCPRNLFCQFNVTSAYNHASEHRQSISWADLHEKSCAFRCLLSFIFDAIRDWDRSTTSLLTKHFQLKENLDIE